MRRRRFLQRGLRWLAGASGLAALGGCQQLPGPNTLVFRGWAYEPDEVRANLDRFENLYPDLRVDYAAVSGNYHDKMVALFLAQTPLDCVYVRDDHFAEWVEAGWLRPIDDLPGALDYRADIFPFNWEAMTYQGRLYGLPYYSDFTIWVYNAAMLEQAGETECARTLPELTEQALRLKAARVRGPAGNVVEYPLVLGFMTTPLGFNDWWALNYASGADLFTDDLEPMFPDDPGRRAERVLQWIVDGIHRHAIIDLHASLTVQLTRDNMAAGRQAYVSLSKYDLQRLNDPEKSSIAGQAKMALYPGLEPDLRGTLGWTRMYCLPHTCRDPEKTWKLLEFVGGRDANGEYATARRWYLRRGLGFAYMSLLDDPEVIESTRRWGDIRLIREQARYARPREIIKAPWFAEFDTFFQAEIQRVLLREVTPRDGLATIAREVRRLRAEWQDQRRAASRARAATRAGRRSAAGRSRGGHA